MTILFYLKPNNYSFPPSGMPIFDGEARRKKERKAYRKMLLERKRKLRQEEEDLVLLILQKLGIL